MIARLILKISREEFGFIGNKRRQRQRAGNTHAREGASKQHGTNAMRAQD
jgi:hypothetical protein